MGANPLNIARLPHKMVPTLYDAAFLVPSYTTSRVIAFFEDDCANYVLGEPKSYEIGMHVLPRMACTCLTRRPKDARQSCEISAIIHSFDKNCILCVDTYTQLTPTDDDHWIKIYASASGNLAECRADTYTLVITTKDGVIWQKTGGLYAAGFEAMSAKEIRFSPLVVELIKACVYDLSRDRTQHFSGDYRRDYAPAVEFRNFPRHYLASDQYLTRFFIPRPEDYDYFAGIVNVFSESRYTQFINPTVLPYQLRKLLAGHKVQCLFTVTADIEPYDNEEKEYRIILTKSEDAVFDFERYYGEIEPRFSTWVDIKFKVDPSAEFKTIMEAKNACRTEIGKYEKGFELDTRGIMVSIEQKPWSIIEELMKQALRLDDSEQ